MYKIVCPKNGLYQTFILLRMSLTVEQKLAVANATIQQYERLIIQYEGHIGGLNEIIQIQKSALQQLDDLLERVEGVFQIQIDREKRANEKLRKQLAELIRNESRE